MDLNNQLKELNDLPVKTSLKHQIYQEIQQKQPKSFQQWKEWVVLSLIACIAMFLAFYPSLDKQVATGGVTEIYKHFDGEEGKFYARASELYLSVERVEDKKIFSFFGDYNQYVIPVEGHLGNYITDVVVVRNGEEERWQVSETGMLNVDTGQFYQENDDQVYEEVFNALYDFNPNGAYLYIIPLILLVSIVPNLYYRHRKIKDRSPLEKNWKYGVFTILLFFSVFAYASSIGPLYTPVLILLALLFGFVNWQLLRRKATYTVYRVESVRNVCQVLLLILLVLFY